VEILLAFKLLVEGWRNVPHSYAIVNQWQLLELARRDDVELRVKDLPLFNSQWARAPHPFGGAERAALSALKSWSSDFEPQATYRISYPLDFAAGKHGQTIVFGTAEYQLLAPSMLKEPLDLGALNRDEKFAVVTPSRWSAQGFVRAGIVESKIAVIPHGVSTSTFYPRADRETLRRRLGLTGFVFLSTGAMTGNKGMDLLLKAFAVVAIKRKDCFLLLKGIDDLYQSSTLLNRSLSRLTPRETKVLSKRLKYTSSALSMTSMGELFCAADAYVSPYRAEGFNLPVLEAAACGTPVICTAGGSTDDFVEPTFALRIASKKVSGPGQYKNGVQLEPSLDHLVTLIERVMDDCAFREGAKLAGPAHVASHYSWNRIADRLLPVLIGSA
jgi:glycosyltransferase involved in cell wall biosynthesis